jgi:triosephosphate isomerase
MEDKILNPLIIANWKMNTGISDASLLATMIRNQLHEFNGVDVVICPPSIWLQEVASIVEISDPRIKLGAQNCYPEKHGPFTGEISVAMIEELCSYVIVGHSERREHFKESNEFINEKVHACLAHNLTPILCIGEKEKSVNSQKRIINDLLACVSGIPKDEYPKIVVAYEPVWSISSVSNGQVASGEYANEVCDLIKKEMCKDTPVIYGGSVTSLNIDDYISQKSIDGVLVGASSLNANNFVGICKKARGE